METLDDIKVDNGYDRNMEYNPKYTETSVSKRVAAFGAVLILLKDAITGAEYALDVEEPSGDTIYTLSIPKWADLSGQSQISLNALISNADMYTKTNDDRLYDIHTFLLREGK